MVFVLDRQSHANNDFSGLKVEIPRWPKFNISYPILISYLEFGRWPILQLSLGLVNIWNLPVALAPNFASIIVARGLGGISSAGGSVTLGMVADIFESDNQQFAVAFIVFSSVGGSVLGPVVGGFVEQFLPWRWCIWIQLIFGVSVQAGKQRFFSRCIYAFSTRLPPYLSILHSNYWRPRSHCPAPTSASSAGVRAPKHWHFSTL